MVVKRSLFKRFGLTVWVPVFAAIITASSSLISVYMQQYYKKQEKLEYQNSLLDTKKEPIQNFDKLNSLLKSILDYYDCDRVVLYEIKSGYAFYNSDKTIQKISATHEVVSEGSSSVLERYQNIPINIFSDFISSVTSDKKAMLVPDVSKEKRLAVKVILSTTGTLSEYSVGVWTSDDKLIGTLSIDFIRSKKVLFIDQLDYLMDKSKYISGFLIK